MSKYCFNPSSIGKALKSEYSCPRRRPQPRFQSIFNWKSLKKPFLTPISVRQLSRFNPSSIGKALKRWATHVPSKSMPSFNPSSIGKALKSRKSLMFSITIQCFNPSSIGKALKSVLLNGVNSDEIERFNPSSIGKALKRIISKDIEGVTEKFQSIFNWKSLKKNPTKKPVHL